MATFTSLPIELRSYIYALARPSFVTITVKEHADLAVTSISSPPALLTTSKESRAAALEWGLKSYSILVGEDYAEFLFSEDISLHLTIIPSHAGHLSVTWTELYTVLGDALLDTKKIVIECSDPQRLARLFMLPEAEYVSMGSSCVEKGLFGSEIVASDREVREALRADVIVCVGEEEYFLVQKKMEGFFGEESFTTKGFSKTSVLDSRDADRSDSVGTCVLYPLGAEVDLQDQAASDEAEVMYIQDAEQELRSLEKGPGNLLTEDALEKFRAAFEKLFPSTAVATKSDIGGSVMPGFD